MELTLYMLGPGKTEAHAASVRTNFPMRPQAGLFYYEVKIVSKGDDGFIGIGFCTKENDLERLPGWDIDSFGYHGDDGHGFAGSGVGTAYGPSYTTGDVIGCGFNFGNASAFYTKNGTLVGTAFTSIDLTKTYYPVVGLRTPGEHVVANFGDNDFVFDVSSYIKEQTNVIWKDILQLHIPPTLPRVEDNDTTALVLNYLLHHGYTNTARSLLQTDQQYTGYGLQLSTLDETCKDTKQRQDIRHAIMEGHIEEAIHLTNKHYPSTLQQGTIILFDLQCGKFVEIMQEYTCQQKKQQRRRSSASSIGSNGIHDNGNGYLNEIPEMQFSPSSSTSTSTSSLDVSDQRRTSWASIAASSGGSSYHSIYSDLSDSSSSHPLPDEKRGSACQSLDDTFDSNMDGSHLLKAAMKLGQCLQEEYRLDKRPYIKERLTEIFSLLAYSDIENSPSAALLDVSCRDLLATNLNSAILKSQFKPLMSPLEKNYQQMVVVNRQLMYEGNGQAILMKMNSLDSLNHPS
ncbi:hypothetical protein BC941DRAFT_422579, partial [Chlamydoabsidia padenii]